MPGTLVRANEIVSRPRLWLWPDRIPLGCLSILDGDPGVNKTTLTCYIASRVSLGRPLYGSDESQPRGTVLLLEGEDSLDETRDRLQASGADLSRVLIFDKTTGTVTLPDDIPWLDTTIRENQVRLVVIDPVFDFLGPNANSDQAVRRALRPLMAMAEHRGVAVLLLRHLNKSANQNPLYRGLGSVALIATARYGLLVAADPSDPDRRVLAQTKPHLNTTAESLSFRPIFRNGGVAIEWLGTSTFSATDLLAAGGQHRRSLEEAMVFVYATLNEGPMRAGEIYSLGIGDGHARRTIRRALETLADWERVGFGAGGYTRWSLLPDNEEAFVHLRERIVDDPEDGRWHGDDGALPDDDVAPDDGSLVPDVGGSGPSSSVAPITADVPSSNAVAAPPIATSYSFSAGRRQLMRRNSHDHDPPASLPTNPPSPLQNP